MWQSQLDVFELDSLEDSTIQELPEVFPRFFVPALENKPQNPIIENLKLTAANKALPPRPAILPRELAILTALPDPFELSTGLGNNLWREAVLQKLKPKNQILSWDRLHTPQQTSTSSPFLSEQDEFVVASAHFHVQPQLDDPSTRIVYVSQGELLISLKMTVLGTSSTLHAWNALSETFEQVGTASKKRGLVLIDNKDEVISSSLISRFLCIGTLLRRLETYLTSLRTRSANLGPTIHAYAHSLFTVLAYLRDRLVQSPPSVHSIVIEKIALSAIWMHYSIYEEILIALAELIGRDFERSPNDYTPLDYSPIPLLTRIYDQLQIHLDRQSPRILTAIFAFILTRSSQDYFRHIAASVGYNNQFTQTSSPGEILKQDEDDEDDEKQDNIFDILDKTEEKFPLFFPPELLNVLSAAQKSLVLLQRAQPDHPVFTNEIKHPPLHWFWAVEEIETACVTGVPISASASDSDGPSPAKEHLNSPHTPSALANDQTLAQFLVFDLEPGSSIIRPSETSKKSGEQSLHSFIESFPECLPAITPTLSHLTSLVFKDLVQHASNLSSSVLSVFTSSHGNINFQSHLILLRSYLLLTAPQFKSRLAAALFSDSDSHLVENKARSMSIQALRRKSSKANESSQPWAVGLSPDLLERDTWPPVGADLSFFLRTVIVDSFENINQDSKTSQIYEEAGWRLGFAIRDLPVGAGRDKWLNPLSIEALDFLYMDYKAPHPLELLISDDIMSKYQRIFAFILRLMRVENAIKSLYRMTRSPHNPVFPTLASSRKHFFHFRFIAQNFISNVTEYIFDTAIGGNFDPFLARTGYANDMSATSPGFSDVFELGRIHSSMLDDILSACLLRSGQKSVGELLRHSLEVVLEFTIVIGELYRGRLQEYQAAPMIEDLFQRFRTKMSTLTKVLKGLAEKNAPPRVSGDVGSSSDRRPVGGSVALYYLLLRLNLNDWWMEWKEASSA